MKIFLCWSGSRSKKIAETLGDYIQQIIQAVEPWISTDISKGLNWVKEIGHKLEEINFGIICLTRENLNEKWILFEAGALSKKQGSHVCIFLCDLKQTDIEPPLALYQHTIFEKEDVRKLLHTINNKAKELEESKIPNDKLDKIFERYWPDLEKELKKIVEIHVEKEKPIRSEREILEEILEILRTQGQIYPRTFVSSVPFEMHNIYHPQNINSGDEGIVFSTVQPNWQIGLGNDKYATKIRDKKIRKVKGLDGEHITIRLLHLISRRAEAYEEELIGMLGLEQTKARSFLEKLCKSGLIYKDKNKKGTYYHLTDRGRDYLVDYGKS